MAKSRSKKSEVKMSEAVGKLKKEIDQASSATIDPQNLKLLQEAEIKSGFIVTHGYFPKEIIRFLVTRLKEDGVPCEVGYDRELAESGSDIAISLKENYRDSKPYYFLAFPLEYRKKAKLILSETSYPLPEDEETERKAALLLEKKKKAKAEADFRRMLTYLVLFVVGGIALYAFLLLAEAIVG